LTRSIRREVAEGEEARAAKPQKRQDRDFWEPHEALDAQVRVVVDAARAHPITLHLFCGFAALRLLAIRADFQQQCSAVFVFRVSNGDDGQLGSTAGAHEDDGVADAFFEERAAHW
jgi:hypothetical protein